MRDAVGRPLQIFLALNYFFCIFLIIYYPFFVTILLTKIFIFVRNFIAFKISICNKNLDQSLDFGKNFDQRLDFGKKFRPKSRFLPKISTKGSILQKFRPKSRFLPQISTKVSIFATHFDQSLDFCHKFRPKSRFLPQIFFAKKSGKTLYFCSYFI